MTAPSLSPERSRELEDLRRRAYGPEADIALDPAAQQRLEELEELARILPAPDPLDEASEPDRIRGPEPFASAIGAEVAEAPDETAEQSSQATSQSDDAPAVATQRASRRSGWRRVPLWTIAGIVGVALGVGIGLAWPTDSSPPPDLTLGIDPEGGQRGAGFAENLHYWGVDEGSLVPHEPYDVIQVWTAFGVDGSRCLLLSHDGSFLSATCTGSGLDPVLDFTVYDGLSLDLDESLPIGTVIRFLGHEGSVDVWVRPPGGQAPSASSRIASSPSRA